MRVMWSRTPHCRPMARVREEEPSAATIKVVLGRRQVAIGEGDSGRLVLVGRLSDGCDLLVEHVSDILMLDGHVVQYAGEVATEYLELGHQRLSVRVARAAHGGEWPAMGVHTPDALQLNEPGPHSLLHSSHLAHHCDAGRANIDFVAVGAECRNRSTTVTEAPARANK